MPSWSNQPSNSGLSSSTTMATTIENPPPMTAARWMTGPAPMPAARRADTARATSCSSGCMMPLPTANISAQNTPSAL